MTIDPHLDRRSPEPLIYQALKGVTPTRHPNERVAVLLRLVDGLTPAGLLTVSPVGTW